MLLIIDNLPEYLNKFRSLRGLYVYFDLVSCRVAGVYLPPQNPTLLNPKSIGNSRAIGLSVESRYWQW